MSWRAWRPVLGELERHHDVFALTLSGHRGGTPWPDGTPVRVDALVDSVCHELDEAGLDAVHVVGNSLGGWVALELARRGRALSCVALSPAGAWRRPFDLARLKGIFALGFLVGGVSWARRALGPPWLRRLLLEAVMQRGDRLPAADVEGFFDDLVAAGTVRDLLRAAQAADHIAPFPTMPCPVRVAWAEHDHIVPWRSYGVPMRDALPGAEFVLLPGCGHVPMWDDPALVGRVVLQISDPAPG
jgi:pimeloyl-ACP methyl ester carboxylesterase